MHVLAATMLLSGSLAAAHDLPDNLKTIYDNHKVSNQDQDEINSSFIDPQISLEDAVTS